MTLDSRGVVGVANLFCWWRKKYGFAFASSTVWFFVHYWQWQRLLSSYSKTNLTCQCQCHCHSGFFFYLCDIPKLPMSGFARRLGGGPLWQSKLITLWLHALLNHIFLFITLLVLSPWFISCYAGTNFESVTFLFALHQRQTNPNTTSGCCCVDILCQLFKFTNCLF